MIDYLDRIVIETWSLVLIVSPWILAGLLIAGIIHAFIGEGFIRHHLGGSGLMPVIKSTIFGIPLPVCSCGVIPIAAGLRKEGASKASTMAFLVSTPTTGIDSLLVTYAFLGIVYAIARPLAALVAGFLIGGLVYASEKEAVSKITDHGRHDRIPLLAKIKKAFDYGFGVLPEDIGKTLVLGLLAGGILTALLPKDLAGNYLSNPLIAYPLVLAIAIPLYVCAIGSVPIAGALLMKGLTPGAALTFLIAGPATNTVTLAFVGRAMGKRILILYLFAIIAISIVFGIILDLVAFRIPISGILSPGERVPYIVQLSAAIILLFVIAVTFLKPKPRPVEMAHSFYVPNMTCKHCAMKIEEAIRKVAGVRKIAIHPEEKLVMIDGQIEEGLIRKKIEEAGFTVAQRQDVEDGHSGERNR